MSYPGVFTNVTTGHFLPFHPKFTGLGSRELKASLAHRMSNKGSSIILDPPSTTVSVLFYSFLLKEFERNQAAQRGGDVLN